MYNARSKAEKYLSIVQKLTKPGFACVLGLDPKVLLETLHLSLDVSAPSSSSPSSSTATKLHGSDNYPHSFRYKIQKDACILAQKQGNNYGIGGSAQSHIFPLSAYLALFDEYSTIVLAHEDRTTRPGVSVSLFAQLQSDVSSIKIGQEIDIKVRVTKIGNIFGFADAEAICCESGKVIASGKHVKYLPAGSYVQSLLLGPLLPLTAWITSKETLFGAGGTQIETPLESNITMDEALSLNTSADQGNDENAIDEANDAVNFFVQDHHCNPNGSLHVSIDTDEKYFTVVIQSLSNFCIPYFAFIKGGCQAMLIESIGNRYMENFVRDESITVCDDDHEKQRISYSLESIQMTYMSQGKGLISFQTERLDRGNNKVHSSSIVLNVKAFCSKKGRAISEGILYYELSKNKMNEDGNRDVEDPSLSPHSTVQTSNTFLKSSL